MKFLHVQKIKKLLVHKTNVHLVMMLFFFISVALTTLATIYFAQTNKTNARAATDYILGTATIGGTHDSGDGNSVTCNRYVATTSGTMRSMSVYVGDIDPNNKYYSLALYADNATNPSNLINSATGILSANTWNTLAVSASIVNGNAYWLCYNTSTFNNSFNNMKYAAGSAPAIYKEQLSGTWPNPFGNIGGKWTTNFSLYATVDLQEKPFRSNLK